MAGTSAIAGTRVVSGQQLPEPAGDQEQLLLPSQLPLGMLAHSVGLNCVIISRMRAACPGLNMDIAASSL